MAPESVVVGVAFGSYRPVSLSFAHAQPSPISSLGCPTIVSILPILDGLATLVQVEGRCRRESTISHRVSEISTPWRTVIGDV